MHPRLATRIRATEEERTPPSPSNRFHAAIPGRARRSQTTPSETALQRGWQLSEASSAFAENIPGFQHWEEIAIGISKPGKRILSANRADSLPRAWGTGRQHAL